MGCNEQVLTIKSSIMKHFYLLILRFTLALLAILFAMTPYAQDSLSFSVDLDTVQLDPGDTYQLPEYGNLEESDTSSAEVPVKYHTEPGYLGKVSKSAELTAKQPGTGWLIAKYHDYRDSVVLIVNGIPKAGDDEDEDDSDYPKVKIVPGSIKVAASDSVELYAFYVDSTDTKMDTTMTWSVYPEEIGSFPDSANSMFYAGEIGKGIIIATLGDLADTIKVTVVDVKKGKGNKGQGPGNNNKGKQLTIMPGDTVVDITSTTIQYEAEYKTNGNKHHGQEFLWSVSDTAIASIDSLGVLTLSGETGMTLVSVKYSNFEAFTELLVVDSAADPTVNNIVIQRVLPDGTELKAKHLKEGESYKIGGLPYPLNALNGGMLHFPFGCIDEDITIYMFIPEEYASEEGDSIEVVYDEIINGVKFSVKPDGSDTIVEPYWFDTPIDLRMVFKHELLDSLGIAPHELDVFFADSTGFIMDGIDGVAVDTVRNKIYAKIAHFSTIVVRQQNSTTGVMELTRNNSQLLAYPNPFNTTTRLAINLEEDADVHLVVHNITGQIVNTLIHERLHRGTHEYIWDGSDQNGQRLPSGIYFCRMLIAGKIGHTNKLIINR